jgi:hypothetical protein
MVENWKPTESERLQFLDAVEKYIREHSYVSLFESEYKSVLDTLDKVVLQAEGRRFRSPKATKAPTAKIDLKPMVEAAAALKVDAQLELEMSDEELSQREIAEFVHRLRGSLYASRPTHQYAWELMVDGQSVIVTKRVKGM